MLTTRRRTTPQGGAATHEGQSLTALWKLFRQPARGTSLRKIGGTTEIRRDAGRRLGHDPGMADDLEKQYQALVERVRCYPMPEAARVAILAEIEAAYRRALAERRRVGGRQR